MPALYYAIQHLWRLLRYDEKIQELARIAVTATIFVVFIGLVSGSSQ